MKTAKQSEVPTHNLALSAALDFVEMRSASHSNCCYSTHSHDEFSFGVIDQGQGLYKNTQSVHHLTSSNLVTINPGDAHSCNPQSEDWSYRMLFVDTKWVGQLQQQMGMSAGLDYLPFEQHYLSKKHSYRQFSQLYSLLQNESNPLLVEGSLIEYLGQLFNQITVEELPKNNNLSLVQQLIMDELDSQLPLTQLCAEVNLSAFHLIRSFKQQFGQTPHAYQLDQRIKKAKLMLKEGRSLTHVALSLGFADQSHFQRHFKKRIAITPKQYQQFFSGKTAGKQRN